MLVPLEIPGFMQIFNAITFNILLGLEDPWIFQEEKFLFQIKMIKN